MTVSHDPSPPLEIPRVVITPSTPQDDPPALSHLTSTAGRRPKLARSQSLLDQIDTCTSTTSTRKELLSPQFPSQSPSPRHGSRPGRGTAASLILVAMAFMLVLSSAFLSPETVAGLLHSEKMWLEKGHWTSSSAEPKPTLPIEALSTQLDDALAGITTSADHTHMEIHSEQSHETAGPVMSHGAWRSYLRRREQVTGRAGPTAHLEAWDFH